MSAAAIRFRDGVVTSGSFNRYESSLWSADVKGKPGLRPGAGHP